MEITTITNEKIFFKFLISNKNFEYPEYIFNVKEIRKIYFYIKEYYDEYKSIPKSDIIKDKTEVDIKIINNLLNLEDFENYDVKWVEDNFYTYLKKVLTDRTISEIITDSREGNIDKVTSKLKIDVLENYKKEKKLKPIDYTKASKAEIKKYNKSLNELSIEYLLDVINIKYDNKIIYKEEKYLLYPILKEKQLAMIFGLTGDGKSVFALEMANMIASGISHWENFRVDTEPQNVIYMDFELGAGSFTNRYKNVNFSENLKVINISVNEYNKYIGFNSKQNVRLEKALEYIEYTAISNDSKIIFIDNLSNIADQVEQASEADRFISDLYGRMKALCLTIIFLGHTPKIPINSPITLNQLKGSSSLTKTFESIIGFKRSAIDSNISYIKQLKSRDLEFIFHDENVATFKFDKDPGWQLKYNGTEIEDNLLIKTKTVKSQKYDDVIKMDVLYDLLENKIDIITLSKNYSIPKTTIWRFKEELKEDLNMSNYIKFKNNKEDLFNDGK